MNSLISPNPVFGQLSLVFLLYGIVIGAVGAVIATRGNSWMSDLERRTQKNLKDGRLLL